MSYLVLARKYRPKSFAEVAGQDVVTRTLRGAIDEERVGHAYLFYGPRGTGKTTSARLFAKALNCEQGPIAEPCGTCARCRAHDAGNEADLIEIDAASNTGVDHVRALIEQAAYAPLAARYKVFLVDEVHMLSKGAFNALLKTLEEPPRHVKFLFATTELHKVPDTVRSRCQLLQLSPLTEDLIRARLDEVFALEGVEAEAGVTAEIARLARGGMRDALSLADQLLALVGRTPTVADTSRLAGEGTTEAVEAVLDAILAEDKRALLEALPSREGGEAAFLDAALDHLRTALVLAVVGDDAPMVGQGANPAVRARMVERAKAFGAERVELLLQELLHARERFGPVHMRAHARLVLETTLLDLCRPEATMPIDELCRRLEALEARLGGAPAGPASVPAAPAPPARAAAPAPPAAQPPAPREAATPEPDVYVPPVQRRPAPEPRAPEPRAPEPAQQAPSTPAPAEGEVRVHSGPEPAPRRPASPRDRRAPAAAPRVQTNSTADRWDGFLHELRGHAAALADVVARKGRLVRDSDGVAPLKLRGLTADERAMVDDRRAARAIQAAFAAANGEGIRLKLEIHDEGGGDADPFTKEIAERFGGRIED